MSKRSAISSFRLFGKTLNPNSQVWFGLTCIYGVGKTSALQICGKLGINPLSKVAQIPADFSVRIRRILDTDMVTEHHLIQKIGRDIATKIEMQCYEGRRHLLGLPVRGQRTSTNAKTQKRLAGPRASKLGYKNVFERAQTAHQKAGSRKQRK